VSGLRSIDGTGTGVRRGTILSFRRRGRNPAAAAVVEASVEEIPRVGPKLVAREAEPSVSIVIPAKNEARNLPYVLARLPEDGEVILVDGNSSDDTIAVAQQLRPDIIVIHQTREGKGNALACGFAAASGDFIVMIDADGSNDPAEIPHFIATLKAGADFAKGSRFLPGGGSLDISWFRRWGNTWLNRIVNVMYGTRYTDLCYGYNAFRRGCLDVMELNATEIEGSPRGAMLWGDGFEVETLINVRIAKAGLRVTEVPSFESCRHFGVSNLNAFSDGMRVLRTIHAESKGAREAASVYVGAERKVAASWALLSTITDEAA
jgi:glycosyltransferase involved in cell wall biosynthesis